mgnify:CR=1 FL=1
MGAKLKDRVGEKGISNEGYSMEIVAYRSAKDMDVLIDGQHLREGVLYSNFRRGKVSYTAHNPLILTRVGEKSVNKQGYSLEIVAYRHAYDIDVLVDGWCLREGVPYKRFKQGSIMLKKTKGETFTSPTGSPKKKVYKRRVADPFRRSVYDVGYIGAPQFNCSADAVTKRIYESWVRMLGRCYDESVRLRNPTYIGCTVCEEWHNLQVYLKWYNGIRKIITK